MALCTILKQYQAYVKVPFRSRHKTLMQSTSDTIDFKTSVGVRQLYIRIADRVGR